MTTLSEARQDVYSAFVMGWNDETSYMLGTESFDTEQIEEYARLTVRHTGSRQTSLGSAGNRKFERRAVAFVQVFTTSSDDRLDELISLAQGIFEGVSLANSTVSFLNVDLRETGTDGKHSSGLIEARFRYEEIL